jgi:hypothetical protein
MISYSWLFTLIIIIVFTIWILFYHFEIGVNSNIKLARKTHTIADPGIVSLRTAEFYNQLTPMNKALRSTCSPKYRLPTEDETSQLNPSFLQAYYLLNWKTPYLKDEEPQWIIAEKDTESGMPHTLANYVILPDGFWIGMSSNDLVNLFVHEICHIHQRQHPREWNTFYMSKGFQLYPSWIILPNQRMNPDTIEHGMWAYDEMIPVEIFKKNARTIRDTDLVWKPMTIRSIETFETFHLKKERDDEEDYHGYALRRDFPFILQLEHPNEIYASMIAENLSQSSSFFFNRETETHLHMADISKSFFKSS